MALQNPEWRKWKRWKRQKFHPFQTPVGGGYGSGHKSTASRLPPLPDLHSDFLGSFLANCISACNFWVNRLVVQVFKLFPFAAKLEQQGLSSSICLEDTCVRTQLLFSSTFSPLCSSPPKKNSRQSLNCSNFYTVRDKNCRAGTIISNF